MKKILIGAVILLSIFFIYLNTIDKKVYYLALGDSLAVGVNAYGTSDYGYTDYVKNYLEDQNMLETYVGEYSASGYRSTDLKRDIIDNKKVSVNGREITFKNALIKADLVTLSIGSNDFFYYLNANSKEVHRHIGEVMSDMTDLFSLIREYCKEDIIVIGYYTPYKEHEHLEQMDAAISYANKRLKALCEEYNMNFIEVFDLFKDNDYLPNPNDIHPSNKGYEAISSRVIASVEKMVFK